MDVRLPDGRVIRNVPEGMTQADLMARVNKAAAPAEDTPVEERDEQGNLVSTSPIERPFGSDVIPTPVGGSDTIPPPVDERTPFAQAQQASAPEDLEDRGDFGRGLASGYQNLVGMIGGLGGLVGDTTGNDNLRDWGMDVYKNRAQRASDIAPRVQGLEDIGSLGDFFDAAQGWLGSSGAFMATTLAGGGAGGMIGRAVAKKSIERMVEKGITRKVAEKAVEAALKDPQGKILTAIKRGAMTGSFATSALTQQGGLYADLKEAGVDDAALPAWGFGAVQGALDVLPEMMVLKKLLPGQVQEELSKSLVRGIAKTAGKQVVAEGSTEGAQQALSSLARITAGGASWDDKDTQDVLTNMAAGAVVGSVLGGGAEVASRLSTRGPAKRKLPGEIMPMEDPEPFDPSTVDVAGAANLSGSEKLQWLQYLNRDAPAEMRQAYEQQHADKQAMSNLTNKFSGSGAYEDEDLSSANIIGKNGAMEDSANARGEIQGRAQPWASVARAEEAALQLQDGDLDADYYARRVTDEDAQKLGVQPGVYVFSQPKVGAETVSSTTGHMTRAQAARSGAARARAKWDALPRSLKQQQNVKGANKYGILFERQKGDEKQDVTMDAREITKLGFQVEPSIAKVRNRGEQLYRAFQAGLAEIIATETGGASYKLIGSSKEKMGSFAGKTVLQEFKGGDPITLAQARGAYSASVEKGMERQRGGGMQQAGDREADIYRDRPEVETMITGSKNPAELEAETQSDRPISEGVEQTPVFDRGAPGVEAEAAGADMRGVTESEATQNLRSTTVGQPAPGNRNPPSRGAISPEFGTGNEETEKAVGSAVQRRMQGIAASFSKAMGFGADHIQVHTSIDDLTAAMEADGQKDVAEYTRQWVKEHTKDGKPTFNGFHSPALGRSYVYVSPTKGIPQMVNILLHEVGHSMFRAHYDYAPYETRQALSAAYRRDRHLWRGTKRNDVQREGLDSRYAFEEWMADQTLAWATNNEKPKNVVEKFFKELADQLRIVWQAIKRDNPAAPEFEKFIDFIRDRRDRNAAPSQNANQLAAIQPADEAIMENRTPAGVIDSAKQSWDGFTQKHPSVDNTLSFAKKATMAAHNKLVGSLQGIMRRMKIPAVDEIRKHFNLRPGEKGGRNFYENVQNQANSFNGEYRKVVNGLTKDEMNELHQELLLERDINLSKMSPKLKERGVQLRRLFQRVYLYMKNSDLPIGKVENYFPAISDLEQLGTANAVSEITAAIQQYDPTAKQEDIIAAIDGMKNDSYSLALDTASLDNVSDNLSSPFAQALKPRTLKPGWRDAIRSIKDKDGNAKYYAKDFDTVMMRYLHQAVRRSEFNKILGDRAWNKDSPPTDQYGQPIPFDALRKLKILMGEARRQGMTPDQHRFMNEAMEAFMGTYKRIETDSARKLVNTLGTYQNLRLMSLVTLASFPDLANNVLVLGNSKGVWSDMMNNFKTAWKTGKERDELLAMAGHAQDAGDQTFLNSLTDWDNLADTKASKVNNAFFRGVGAHKWTVFTKAFAAANSRDYILRAAAEGNTAKLDELGITADQVKLWQEAGMPAYGQPGWTEEDADPSLASAAYTSPEQLAATKAVTGGITRMVNEIVVAANPPEKTLWGNSQRMKLVWQFKNFLYGYTMRVMSRMWHNISKDGATTADKAMMAAGIGLTLGLAAFGLELKDFLQNTLWGNKSKLHDKNGFEYIKLVANRSGALGLASMALDVNDAADNGRAPLVAMAGPTISQVNDAFQYGVAHAAAGGVPLVSVFPGFRDGFKEMLK